MNELSFSPAKLHITYRKKFDIFIKSNLKQDLRETFKPLLFVHRIVCLLLFSKSHIIGS